MVNVLYRTPTELNSVGCEMRIVEMEGDKMIEVVTVTQRKFSEKLRLIFNILFNKPVICSSVVMDDRISIVEVNNEQTAEKRA